jgi:hypothetical protein
MEPHAIPRQITTFEFKLIGFLTLKQFIYLIICTAIGVIFYLGIPVPLLNFLFAGCAVALGIALSFLPINERPLDVWIRNLINRLLQPSQFYYHKHEEEPAFLKNVYFQTSPQIINTHIDAMQKLNGYVNKTTPVDPATLQKNQIQSLISSSPAAPPLPTKPTSMPTTPPIAVAQATMAVPPVEPAPTPTTSSQLGTIFLGGSIKNSKNMALPNILIYIKNLQGTTLRILKSNSQGQFATYHPMDPGMYLLEPKDNSQKYFFDTMNIKVENSNPTPLVIVSKELI